MRAKAARPPASRTFPRGKGGNKSEDMGSALRSVYQRTVEEAVPDEFLDLLGKLD